MTMAVLVRTATIPPSYPRTVWQLLTGHRTSHPSDSTLKQGSQEVGFQTWLLHIRQALSNIKVESWPASNIRDGWS